MHEHYLMLALAKAKERLGFCYPNPAVGACIVHQNEVLVLAHHEACGKPHAEQNALLQLKSLGVVPDETTTLYVTLEPCNHWGKTPPCTGSIIKSGIKRVIYGYRDPNPIVSKTDTEKLLFDASIACQQLRLPAIDVFYESYQYWIKYKRPFVTFKIAQTLDGKIAANDGRAFPITNACLKTLTHQHRLEKDAILTTAKTLINDNARMNVRLDGDTIKKPVLVLDSHLSLKGQETIFTTAKHLYIFHQAEITPHFAAPNVSFIPMAVDDEGGLTLMSIFDYIGSKLGMHHVFIEAGGTLFSALLKQNLLNRAYVYLAPFFMGVDAPAVFQGNIPMTRLQQAFTEVNCYDNQWVYTFDFIKG